MCAGVYVCVWYVQVYACVCARVHMHVPTCTCAYSVVYLDTCCQVLLYAAVCTFVMFLVCCVFVCTCPALYVLHMYVFMCLFLTPISSSPSPQLTSH